MRPNPIKSFIILLILILNGGDIVKAVQFLITQKIGKIDKDEFRHFKDAIKGEF